MVSLVVLYVQVMPGLLLCFVLRYDTYKKAQTLSAEAGVPPPLNYVQRISYFHCSLVGYFLGRTGFTVHCCHFSWGLFVLL